LAEIGRSHLLDNWITGIGEIDSDEVPVRGSSDEELYISTNGRTATMIGYFFHELGTDKETSFKSLLASILGALLGSFNTLASYTSHTSWS